MRRIVLVELNEVPNPVLDAYAERSPFMAKFLRESRRYETIAADQLQLDPWIAWPSFHRGVPDTVHGILRLGQDVTTIDAAYPPAWSLLMQKGLSVGVYGSLYSSGERDLDPYAFFVPDAFSPHGKVHPERLQEFQGFNLAMTRASARNPSDKVMRGALRALMPLTLDGSLSAGTIARAGVQLARERLDRAKLARRRNVQTELHGDLFMSLLHDKRPDFATFYTNNVAAAMHRFWSASFPEKSINADKLSKRWLAEYGDEVFSALASVERLLRRLVEEAPTTTIVLASAIGQDEIPASNMEEFATIVDLYDFVHATLEDDGVVFEALPTMVPDFSIRFAQAADASRFCDRLGNLKIGEFAAKNTLQRMTATAVVDAKGGPGFIRHSYGADSAFKHPVTFGISDPHTVHLSVQIDEYSGPQEVTCGNRALKFSECGLGFVQHSEGVNCTAQHCAEGALAVRRPGGVDGGAPLEMISTMDFMPSLLQHFGVPTPAYMNGRPSVLL